MSALLGSLWVATLIIEILRTSLGHGGMNETRRRASACALSLYRAIAQTLGTDPQHRIIEHQ
jgi:hypothetical protein